jgi:probable rRNA maturation factor
MVHGPTAQDAASNGFELSLSNQQMVHAVDESSLIEAARMVLSGSKFTSATISLAVVDDPTIHALNRQFLNHDYPTDVLSFVLDASNSHLNGEVVLSADTAASAAAEAGWTPANEQLLYVIHGMLHLIGLDDRAEADALKMRAAERFYLQECGVAWPNSLTSQSSLNEIQGAGGNTAW